MRGRINVQFVDVSKMTTKKLVMTNYVMSQVYFPIFLITLIHCCRHENKASFDNGKSCLKKTLLLSTLLYFLIIIALMLRFFHPLVIKSLKWSTIVTTVHHTVLQE